MSSSEEQREETLTEGRRHAEGHAEDMMAKGLIVTSESEWAAQAVMVKKVKDGVELEEKRPCWGLPRAQRPHQG